MITKPIKDFLGYRITDRGQIIGRRGKLLKISKGKYPFTALCRNGKNYRLSIHRLVLETFIGPCPPGMEANHKDGNKYNSDVDNLEWVTRSENRKHAFRVGLQSSRHLKGDW